MLYGILGVQKDVALAAKRGVDGSGKDCRRSAVMLYDSVLPP